MEQPKSGMELTTRSILSSDRQLPPDVLRSGESSKGSAKSVPSVWSGQVRSRPPKKKQLLLVFGSSHVAPHRRMPWYMDKKWQANSRFNKHFSIEFHHYSGGKASNKLLIDKFVRTAEQKSNSGYFKGLKVLIILGSNDRGHGHPESLRSNMQGFLERLLLIKKINVTVSTIFPRRDDSKLDESRIIESVVKNLQISHANVNVIKLGRFLHNLWREQGDSIWERDGVHLRAHVVPLVVDEIYKCVVNSRKFKLKKKK